MKNVHKISTLFLFCITFGGGLIQAYGHTHAQYSSKVNPDKAMEVPADADEAKVVINGGEANKNGIQVKSMVLPGELTFDPNGYTEIHPTQIGRVVIDLHNPMPQTGTMIEKGQVIAVLEDFIPKMPIKSKRES